MKILCIFHGNCADGFGSAWAVHEALQGSDHQLDFFPGVYQQPPPDVAGKVVLLVDFCYKPEVMEDLARSAHAIVILDHHKTAMEDFQSHSYDNMMVTNMGAWPDPTWERLSREIHDHVFSGEHLYYLFDMDRSGAMITWQFFHEAPPPQLMLHIQDRDLWRFEMDNTREIQAAVFSYPYDFQVWTGLMEGNIHALANQGIAIERKHHKDVQELVGICKREMEIDGHKVPVASLPYTMVSDAAHLMALDAPFAACYWDTPEGRTFGLRSVEGGMDVGEIARSYGGGGHKHAAGFSVKRYHHLAMD